ncbi:MAG: helix-turn-helix transcriptional regulator [Oscillospiraceae bacterium]|nr:helix-turn-helix transcriptional regulator [Oscillospiraceae bacterium]
MSNVRQSTIDNIMHGASRNPGIQTLHKIALTFNMTLSEFLDYPELNEFSFDDNSPDDEE